jgi:hypothetical protein
VTGAEGRAGRVNPETPATGAFSVRASRIAPAEIVDLTVAEAPAVLDVRGRRLPAIPRRENAPEVHVRRTVPGKCAETMVVPEPVRRIRVDWEITARRQVNALASPIALGSHAARMVVEGIAEAVRRALPATALGSADVPEAATDVFAGPTDVEGRAGRAGAD